MREHWKLFDRNPFSASTQIPIIVSVLPLTPLKPQPQIVCQNSERWRKAPDQGRRSFRSMHLRKFSEDGVKGKNPQIALACLFCASFQSFAQAPSGAVSTPIATADPFVMTWKPNGPGCDDRYENGLEEKGLFTNQASLIIFLIPDSGKLAVSIYVGNPAEGVGRLEVIPENFHLLKVTDKGLSELKRADAVKMAKSMERRERIVQSIAAGLSSYGSQTTATGVGVYRG
jgi:hypothetical protein